MKMSSNFLVLQAVLITRRAARIRRWRVKPGLLARLLAGPVCVDVVPGLPDARLILAARDSTLRITGQTVNVASVKP